MSDPPLPGGNLQPQPAHLLSTPAPAHLGAISVNPGNIHAHSSAGPTNLITAHRIGVVAPMVHANNSGSVDLSRGSGLFSQPPQVPSQAHVVQPTTSAMPVNYAPPSSAIGQQQREYNEPVDTQVVSGNEPFLVNAQRRPIQPFGTYSHPPQSEQQLKVEDALNYLDQVKYKFGNQPQVYNQFLDIMKDFKGLKIDTPGVINRVSNLFRGHPELVVGFNAFLPAGFKIEMQGQGSDVEYVVRTNIMSAPGSTELRDYRIHAGPVQVQTQPPLPPATILQPVVQNLQIARPPPAHSANREPITITPAPAPPRAIGSPPTIDLSTAYEEPPSPPSFTHSCSSPFVQSAFPTLHSQPVEFNHAINYVSKIKSRFSAEPHKYIQFLEILHNYQNEKTRKKEKKEDSDSDDVPGQPPKVLRTEQDVYGEVSRLFEGHEDLLREFSQFLPDATGNKQSSARAKKVVEHIKKTVPQPPAPKPAPIPIKRPSILAPDGPQSRKSKITEPVIPDYPDVPLSEAEKYGSLNDFALFDTIRTALNNKQVHINFLRCLRLYNDQIISKTDLINLVQPFFIKHIKIFNIFKNFLAESERDVEERAPPSRPGITGLRSDKLTEDQIMEIDFSSCKRLGASYCAVPNSTIQPICSGRTDRENEVLNDMWVSFPTWSEDSTFVNSRKTTFEEYIHRCEDERFELDAAIETNMATIQTLNNVEDKMSRMSAKELAAFKLDDNLGGSSQAIYHRAIRRLYGDKSGELVQALKENPFRGVPVVLTRLKSKHLEWTEAQKECNKVWREQMEKFYLKSLDPQGITFKQADMRVIRPKALLSEIETLMEERQEQESLNGEACVVSGFPHISLQYGDHAVLTDACNLLLHHVRRQSGIHNEDKRKIKQILKHFMFDVFYRERLELSDDDADDTDDEGSNCSSENATSSSTRNEQRKSGSSNTKKMATPSKSKPEPNSRESTSSGSESNADSTAPGKRKLSAKVVGNMSRRSKAKGKPIKFGDRSGATSRNGKSSKARKPKYYTKDFGAKIDVAIAATSDPDLVVAYNEFRELELKQELAAQAQRNGLNLSDRAAPLEEEAYTLFYANRTWYVFLRLHHILCERLNRILETARNIIAEELAEGKSNVPGPAIQLKLQRPREIEPEDYYSNFLDMVRNLLDGNLELGNYEDTLRERFGIHAYVSFTLDKVIVIAVRQLQQLVTDEKSIKCLELYHRFLKKGGTGGSVVESEERAEAEIQYRKHAEKFCESDGCTRVVISKNQARMNMELLSSDNLEAATKHEQETKLFFISQILRSSSDHARKAKEAIGLTPILLQRNLRCQDRRKNKPRGEHDYIAREYHHGDNPKYYCPKEPADKTTPKENWDLDLDLLHNPDKYKYLYDRDIMMTIVVPPEYIPIPSVVRNALIQKPSKTCTKRDQIIGVGKVRKTRLDKWHRVWRLANTTKDDIMKIDGIFQGSWAAKENNQPSKDLKPRVEPVFLKLPYAPFREIRKYVSKTEPEVYAFPVIQETTAPAEQK